MIYYRVTNTIEIKQVSLEKGDLFFSLILDTKSIFLILGNNREICVDCGLKVFYPKNEPETYVSTE